MPFYETFTTDPVGSEERVLMAKKVLVALSSIAPTALCLIKTSIACLYRRIFSIRPYRILINIWLVVLVAWAIGITIATLLECGTNLWAVVSPNIQEYLTYCTRTLSIGIAYCSTDVATDVITVILPLPMVCVSTSHVDSLRLLMPGRYGGSRCQCDRSFLWEASS